MGSKIDKDSSIKVRVCPICGKNFVPTTNWAYKRIGKFYCRYNCYKEAGGDNSRDRKA